MGSAGRTVIRNHRFQFVGVLSLLLAAGFAVVTYVVIVSPGHSVDHPGGFTPGFRALTVAMCVLVTAVFAAYGIGALRVVLILDESRILIRNPWRTTTVRWESKPRFTTRDREQDVTVISSGVGGAPWQTGRMKYRYREIVCVMGRQQIWIAATSRMWHRDRVEQTLTELHSASNQFAHQAA